VFGLPSHHENFGVSLVEAMASGVPAIVSRGVHLSAAIERAGAGWVVGTDVESMHAGLLQAFQADGGRAARGAAARAFAGRFAWPSVAVELAGLYNGLAGLTRVETLAVEAGA
jgi:glycosyltransferase involved in cell wall biosynthesis